MSIYDFKVMDITGSEVSLETYKGKVLLIVNTASKCGFTKQFKELQEIYSELGNEHFEICGFPCNQFGGQDPNSNEAILASCQFNYGVTFPMFSKIKVNGKDADPLFVYLRQQTGRSNIRWNFTKFLVNAKGEVMKRYDPKETPLSFKEDIMKLINETNEA
jgi:glutathione peroxidase